MRFLHNKVSFIITGTCIVYLLSGCAKAPDAEFTAAKAAIKAAQDAEADKYMAKNFQNMQRALNAAEEEITKQKSTFVLTRKYKRVNEMLQKTIQIATEMKDEAPKLKAEMVAQVKENLELAKGILKETETDIKKASRKQDKAVIEELKAILNEADSTAIRATTDFEAGNVLGASEILVEFQGLIKRITDTLKPKTEG